MNISRFFLPATLLCVTVVLGQNRDQPTGATQGIEVLTRGPVHEAFAETVAFDPEPGIVVPKLPPAIIQETPPEHRWEGKHADWIPGYWSWDDERDDFVWVSGIWRVAPPGRQWVPGYWARAGEGAQWISGYWGDAQHSDVTYLPEPPATLEVGPSGEAPSANHTWLPGNWIWSQTRYAWRSGYWTVGQANWDWIPAHYSWTPSGYVFVDGYYDYSADRRGVLYAPVYFDPTVYNRRDYVYSPTTIINPAVFTNHLFLRPRYGHYYFGDYYGPNYTARGFSPWFSFYANRQGYDPFYAQQRWRNRLNSTWERTIHSNFANYRDQEFSRPPRTWAEQQQRQLQAKTTPYSGPNIAESYSDFVKNKESSYRFQPIEKTERQQYQERERAIRQLSEQRLQSEVEAANRFAKPQPNREASWPRITFPNSPIRGLPIDQLDKTQAPPSRHETPKPDMNIEPKPRPARGPSK